MIWRCDLRVQYKKYKKEIDAAIKKVLKTGQYILAEELSAFEKDFAEYIGSKYSVGVGNATDGLILSLKALEIGQGDEVITTPFTAIPTVSAIIATGAKPVFVDIDEKTFLINIERVTDFITSKTKAIIPVHIFGNVVDVKRLRSLIPENISIIEDAAQSHGSKINGKHTGNMGDIGVFSFYPTKNLGGYGDGGTVVTNNQEIAREIKLLRMYGMTDKDHIVINGINSRLDELQSAVLSVKLKYLDEMNELRNKIADKYRTELDNQYFTFQYIPDNVFCNYHLFTARVNGDRNKLINYLERKKIQTNVYYMIPLHLQEANKFLGYNKGDFPTAEKLCSQIIALPMYPELTTQKLEKIITTINEFVRKYQK
ncbi:MAG: hypothetical protein A2Y09_07910 [Planctomycetes bacterium GWA2_39_15]|nr:MAG: hypothetical protein A2Y09_07910 [Planctomycetes bacterium GWA2_39_15]